MGCCNSSSLDSFFEYQPMAELVPTKQEPIPIHEEKTASDKSHQLYLQILDKLNQIQYSVPEEAYQQQQKNHSPKEIQSRANTLELENKYTNDTYAEARALRATRRVETLEDGRSHINGLTGLIDNIHTDYQKKYGELVKASTQYMQDMNMALGTISRHISAGGDNKIHFIPGKYLASIDKILSKYTNKHYPDDGGYGSYFNNWNVKYEETNELLSIDFTPEAYTFWKKKLDGQGFVVRKHDQKIQIYPDLEYIQETYKIVRRTSGIWHGSDILSQEFQSLQTAIDSQKNAINSSVSRLLETFRQDNSHFETLTQLLIQLYKDLQQYNNGYVNM